MFIRDLKTNSMVVLMYSLLWISTCWLPLMYMLKYFASTKVVLSIKGYKNIDSDEILLKNADVLNDIKDEYTRMEVTYKMNNHTFVYSVLSKEFIWPIEETFEYTWISKAYLVSHTSESDTDVTEVVNMYAGPQRNFYNSTFDFNWIPVIEHSKASELHIYDNNNSCYKIDLATNTEIDDNRLENVCGIKLFCRCSYGFETM